MHQILTHYYVKCRIDLLSIFKYVNRHIRVQSRIRPRTLNHSLLIPNASHKASLRVSKTASYFFEMTFSLDLSFLKPRSRMCLYTFPHFTFKTVMILTNESIKWLTIWWRCLSENIARSERLFDVQNGTQEAIFCVKTIVKGPNIG